MAVADLIPTSWREPVERLRQNISDAFSRWLSRYKGGETDGEDFQTPSLLAPLGTGVELDENDDELIARAALPGLKKSDIKVEVTDDRLVVRGGRRHSSKKKGRGYYHSEESYASFARAVSLPCEIDPDRTKAKYKNGLLTIILPKSERARSKRIKVKISN